MRRCAISVLLLIVPLALGAAPPMLPCLVKGVDFVEYAEEL